MADFSSGIAAQVAPRIDDYLREQGKTWSDNAERDRLRSDAVWAHGWDYFMRPDNPAHAKAEPADRKGHQKVTKIEAVSEDTPAE